MKHLSAFLLACSLSLAAAQAQTTPAPAPAPAAAPAVAQEHAGPVKWMTFEQMLEAQKTEPRKVMIDMYTDWCGWCKRMDANTMTNPFIAQTLNEKYYAVKFDAEQKADVVVNGRTYKFIPSGRNGYHELAAELMNGQMSYPTLVFLDEELKIIQPLPGYRTPQELDPILNYFGGDFYRNNVTWENFLKEYKSPVAP